jgi:GTP-binding protein
VRDIIQIALTPFKKEDIDFDHKNQKNPKIAIVGRPNVGKSTLVNAFLGEDRMIAFDEPGTTRDSIQIDIERNEKSYTLIDTAGIRKKGKVFEAVEKFSVIKTLQAIEEANVSILVINAEDGITEQDAHVGAYILEAGRGLVIAINKWDRLKVEQREIVKQDILRKLHFLKFAEFQYISALKKKGLTEILKSVDEAYRGAFIKLATPKLTSVLIDTLQQHQPPISKGIRPKLRYAHQGGSNPPVIVIHGNHVNAIKHNYMRFLEESFRQAFQIVGTPLRIEFKQGENPFLAEEKRKPKEGVVSMRRRKNALRKKMTDKKRAAEKKL